MGEPNGPRERLAAARAAHLATADATGRPHLVPFCFVLEGDVIYTAVDAKPKSGRTLRRILNLRQNPRVSVLADHYEEDWSRLWWVRADGSARELPPGAESDRALELLAAKYEQYRSAPPPGPVVRIDCERWTAWP